MKRTVLGLLLAALILLGVSPAFSEVTVKKDVLYATHDGVPLYGDLYLPAPT